MKLVKNLFAAVLMLSVAGFAAADEWDDFGGDDGGAAEPAMSISGSAEMAGRVYTDLRNEKNENKRYDAKDMTVESRPSAKLNFDYSGASSDVSFKLKFDKISLGDYKEDIIDEFTARAYLGNFQIEAGKMKTVWGKGDKIHVTDNFNANDYTDFVFPDYVDRRIAEPMFRLVYATPSNIKFEGIVTPMMTVDRLATGGIWQPAKSKTLTETVTKAMKHNLRVTLDNAIGNKDSTDAIDAIMDASSFSSDNLVADNTKSLKYAQAGARTTFTLGGIDFGASYYYGHYKQPSANLGSYIKSLQTAGAAVPTFAASTKGQTAIAAKYADKITEKATARGAYYAGLAAAGQTSTVSPVTGATVDLTNPAVINVAARTDGYYQVVQENAMDILYMTDVELKLPELNYDQVQVFGLEAAFVIWKFNIRGEGAYYLTKDTAGDDPWVKNNSVQWVAGFDMDMPWTNMNLNVQTQGKYIMNSDKIKDGAFKAYDVDYNSDDKYIANKVIVDITDAYAHDSIKIDVKGIYEVETKDFVVMPSLTIKAVDDFTITASGMVIKTDNENSEFFNFRRNSFAQISCKYLF